MGMFFSDFHKARPAFSSIFLYFTGESPSPAGGNFGACLNVAEKARAAVQTGSIYNGKATDDPLLFRSWVIPLVYSPCGACRRARGWA